MWSSGGADYAKQSAVEFGVADCFVAFLPKPTLIIDDQAVSEWRYCGFEEFERNAVRIMARHGGDLTHAIRLAADAPADTLRKST